MPVVVTAIWLIQPVKTQRCTTEAVKFLDGINKDVSNVKLLLTTTSVYPVDCYFST